MDSVTAVRSRVAELENEVESQGLSGLEATEYIHLLSAKPKSADPDVGIEADSRQHVRKRLEELEARRVAAAKTYDAVLWKASSSPLEIENARFALSRAEARGEGFDDFDDLIHKEPLEAALELKGGVLVEGCVYVRPLVKEEKPRVIVELVWARQPDGTYQKSGSLPSDVTHGKVYFEKNGHESGGHLTEKIDEAIASIENGIATGPVNKDKYIIRPCPAPPSIAERIRQNQVQDVWSTAERQFLAEHASDAVALVEYFLPHLSEDVSERRAIKLKARLDKVAGDPWMVIHPSELTPSEECLSAEVLTASLGSASASPRKRKARKYTSCLGCGRRFLAKRANNTICSAKCRQKASRDRVSQIREKPSRRAA